MFKGDCESSFFFDAVPSRYVWLIYGIIYKGGRDINERNQNGNRRICYYFRGKHVPTPVRFRWYGNGEMENCEQVFNIDRVLSISKETMFHGGENIIYTCETSINGSKGKFEISFDPKDGKWLLLREL